LSAAEPELVERRQFWTPAFDSLFEGDNRGLPRAARFLFLELCRAARARREGGILRVPRSMTEAEAVFDLVAGERREVNRMTPLLLQAGKIRFEDRGGARCLVIPSWPKYRQEQEPRIRVARQSAPPPADDTAEHDVDRSATYPDTSTTHHETEANDSADLAVGFRRSERREEKEIERGEPDPRAHARVASPMPTASAPEVEDVPEPEESGVFLRADAPPAPAPVEAPPYDQPITSFSTALGGELASALGSGIAEVSGVPWVPQSRHATGQKLLAMAKLYPELLGLGRKEFLGRWRALGVGFARWADRQSEKNPRLSGFPLFGLEDFLSGEGAKHLQRARVERPMVAKVAPPPRTPEERRISFLEHLEERRAKGMQDLAPELLALVRS